MGEFNCFPSAAKPDLEWSGSETGICFPDPVGSAVFPSLLFSLMRAGLQSEGQLRAKDKA